MNLLAINTDPMKKNLGFKLLFKNTLVFFSTSCDPILTNAMQKLEIKKKKKSLYAKKKTTPTDGDKAKNSESLCSDQKIFWTSSIIMSI